MAACRAQRLLRGPQGVASGQPEAAEGAGGGQALDGVGGGGGAAGEVLEVDKRPAGGPVYLDAFQQRVAEVTDVTEPDPHRPRRLVAVPGAGDRPAHCAVGPRLEGALGAGAVEVGAEDLDAVTAGVVTHRQRPGTAQGVIFINLEDETGLLNVICSPGLWRRYRRVARTSTALLIRGVLERHQGVTNLVAQRLTPLATGSAPRSRDFR